MLVCKSKDVPLHAMKAHEGAWGERRYSSYSFSTSALEGGEWSASRPGRALPPGKGPPVPIVQEAGWDPEPVWTQRLEEKSSASVGDRTPVVQSVVRHYTDWATAAPMLLCSSLFLLWPMLLQISDFPAYIPMQQQFLISHWKVFILCNVPKVTKSGVECHIYYELLGRT
jgi:hypothetical protein